LDEQITFFRVLLLMYIDLNQRCKPPPTNVPSRHGCAQALSFGRASGLKCADTPQAILQIRLQRRGTHARVPSRQPARSVIS